MWVVTALPPCAVRDGLVVRRWLLLSRFGEWPGFRQDAELRGLGVVFWGVPAWGGVRVGRGREREGGRWRWGDTTEELAFLESVGCAWIWVFVFCCSCFSILFSFSNGL